MEIDSRLPSLPTKLYRPSLPPHQVQRPQLLTQLNYGLAHGHNLTLIVAPAGFGKTTLVSQWLTDLEGATSPSQVNFSHASPRFCWFSVDEYDNDLALFLHYLIAAVQRVFPLACVNTLRLIQAPQLPPLPELTTILLDDLAQLEQACILVIEDYHLIAEATIHQLMIRLLNHLPHAIHLILTSRTEPPLSLAQRRLRQQLTEIRAAELCFSAAETAVFLAQSLGWQLERETITTFHAQTEGWAAGLQLAALALQSALAARSRAAELAFVQAFKGSNRHVMDYLMDEVLARQPQYIQEFLMRIAILDRFCAPLCAVLDPAPLKEPQDRNPPLFTYTPGVLLLTNGHGHPILEYLKQSNLFVIQLDDQGEWYRYHHLFRDLLRYYLQTHLDTVAIAALHLRASNWLATHGLIEEALQHALAAGEPVVAAQLVEQHRYALLNQEDWRTLERWLAMLPTELLRQRPNLLIAQAIVLNFQYKRAAATSLLQAAESRLAVLANADDTRALHGEINALYSHFWNKPHEAQRSLAAARLALEQLPYTYFYMRSGALFCLGLTLHLVGQTDDAVQTLQTALDDYGNQSGTMTTRLLLSLAYVYCARGDLTRLAQSAEALGRAATQAKLTISLAWSHYLLGLVHYEWNNLETAAQHFSTVIELRYSAHMLATHDSWLGLALTYQAQGRMEQASQAVAALGQFLHEMNRVALLPATYSFQARLALLQGDLPAANQWARATSLNVVPDGLLTAEIPQFTRIKILLQQATTASLHEATALLAAAQQFAETVHNTMRLIEILALQALVAQAQARRAQALVLVERAVLLASAGNFIRTFLDLGAPLAGLLKALYDRGVAIDYLEQVLAALGPSKFGRSARSALRKRQTTAVTPLTERELEVLLLLAQRFSNQEIGRALTISPLTVRTHTTNLYQKLSVNSRKQAVARARLLGFLPTESANSVL